MYCSSPPGRFASIDSIIVVSRLDSQWVSPVRASRETIVPSIVIAYELKEKAYNNLITWERCVWETGHILTRDSILLIALLILDVVSLLELVH